MTLEILSKKTYLNVTILNLALIFPYQEVNNVKTKL